MENEEILKKMESLLNRCDLLERKYKQWGLTEEEENELITKKIKYLTLYFMSIDNIFTNYIEPLLYDDDIIDIKQEILSKTQWEGNLLFSADEIDNFLNNVDNIDEVIALLVELNEKELIKLKNLNSTKKALLETFNEIDELSSFEKVADYIKMKNIIMISLLEEIR